MSAKKRGRPRKAVTKRGRRGARARRTNGPVVAARSYRIGGRVRGILADSITVRTVNGETVIEVESAARARPGACRVLYQPSDGVVGCGGTCGRGRFCNIGVRRKRNAVTFRCGCDPVETLPEPGPGEE